ncbi:hypothetical protein CACET_c05440 [Clostridium aceticum]|uniref:Uncharacterized protein n=1 Tax=Clostridium aceticum TaxID=84022 RepID=A0A0D8IF01_9CLOT|nr:hypothetical protein CACET_c05440 [Clostridium aceticum]KJF28577.1 hypothetical protein TZ02_01285 [Clostridium aceticum]
MRDGIGAHALSCREGFLLPKKALRTKIIKDNSYPERWRDRPDETQQPAYKCKVLIPTANYNL